MFMLVSGNSFCNEVCCEIECTGIRCVFDSYSKTWKYLCGSKSGKCIFLWLWMCVFVFGCLPHCVHLFTIDDFVFLRVYVSCSGTWDMCVSWSVCWLWTVCVGVSFVCLWVCVSKQVWLNVPLSWWCECDGSIWCLGVAVCVCECVFGERLCCLKHLSNTLATAHWIL